ncbi:hypothetical protein CEXT_381261 [Caerostris extrusa]|uniref:Uncharacterized protein n=1 Tax=Caerostris extrusa TaxID=172846 RepID=A0AAV4XU70_CAEEX|nr:hypothetical protein CEXT_381261 [Caerostris extrusa]
MTTATESQNDYSNLKVRMTTATESLTTESDSNLKNRGSSFEDNAREIDIGGDVCRNNEAYIPEDEICFCVG